MEPCSKFIKTVAFVAVVLVMLVTGSRAHARDARTSPLPIVPVSAEVVFNEPGFHDQPAFTVENKLIDLVNHAAPGSSIRMAMYQITRKPIVEALIEASHRGVDIRMVLDGSNYFDQLKEGNGVHLLVRGSRTQGRLICTDKPCIYFCSAPFRFKMKSQTFGGSCNGLVINHNKFMLFSKLDDGRENVVAQTSFNFEDEMTHEYQDLIIIDGDRGLFEGYTAYWESLFRNHYHLTPWRDARGDGPVTAKFFPRLVGHDPVMQALKRVSCEPAGSSIRIAEANISRTDIAARLRDLAKQGCDVKVITKIEPAVFAPSVGVVKRLGSNVMIMPYKGNEKQFTAKNSIHTKIILIDAALDGSKVKRQLLLTGSHNLDFFSLHTNDETLLEVEDSNVYDQYLAFWNRLNFEARHSGLSLLFGKDR